MPRKDLVCVVDEYANLNIICNAKYDFVIYELAPNPTGKKGRPAKHGRSLSTEEYFTLSDEKIEDYYMGIRRVLPNLFRQREVFAYATALKITGNKSFDFQHLFPTPDADILCRAGKSTLEPDWKQPYVVYSTVVLLLGGTLRSVTMSKKHSGHYAVIWFVVAKGLRG